MKNKTDIVICPKCKSPEVTWMWATETGNTNYFKCTKCGYQFKKVNRRSKHE